MSDPVVISVAPVSGTAGTGVTITGTGLSEVSAVLFGSTAASISAHTDTQIVCTVPSGLAAGAVNLTLAWTGTVTAPGGFAVTGGGSGPGPTPPPGNDLVVVAAAAGGLLLLGLFAFRGKGRER